MKVEVLASVMNASLRETVQHMNLQSDAVIINQCDRLGQEEMQISRENGEARTIRFYSFPDRGIGRSRNEAILRARGDICLFSDASMLQARCPTSPIRPKPLKPISSGMAWSALSIRRVPRCATP